MKRSEVDWTQTRVAFVSPSFTQEQIAAENFKDFLIELWEMKRYEEGWIGINPIKKSSAAVSIKPLVQQNGQAKQVADEIREYTEEMHLEGMPEETLGLYERFKATVFRLGDDLEMLPRKKVLSFRKDRPIVDITILKGSLKIWINLKQGELDDPKALARDVSAVGHWGNGDYEIIIEEDEDLEYIIKFGEAES